MTRNLLLIVTIFCCAFVHLSTAIANDYCPTVLVPPNHECVCTVTNYSVTTDTGIYIMMKGPEGGATYGPFSVAHEEWAINTQTNNHDYTTFCICKVTGEGSYTRTSLAVIDQDRKTIAIVPCN